jgi:RNA polymerase sigma factor (sigma-70 family)
MITHTRRLPESKVFADLPLPADRLLPAPSSGIGSLKTKNAHRGANIFPEVRIFRRRRPITLYRELLRALGAPMSTEPPDLTQAYEQHRDGLRGFLRAYAFRKDSVDDLMQEVYVALMRHPPREALRDPSAYLYKIGWNVLRKANRRTRREPETHDPATLAELSQQTTEDAAAELAAEEQLIALLKELPPLYGAVLILNRRDGLAYSDIATRLNISVSQVRRYLGLALSHLKKANWNL